MYYTYQEHYPNCYSLHRPDGTDIAFLQGDDARDFEEVLEKLKSLEYPHGIFQSFENLLSVNIDAYDLVDSINLNSRVVTV